MSAGSWGRLSCLFPVMGTWAEEETDQRFRTDTPEEPSCLLGSVAIPLSCIWKIFLSLWFIWQRDRAVARKRKVFFMWVLWSGVGTQVMTPVRRVKRLLGNSSNPGFLCLVTLAQDAFQDLLFCLMARCSTQYCTDAQGQPCSQYQCCSRWLWAAPRVHCGSFQSLALGPPDQVGVKSG